MADGEQLTFQFRYDNALVNRSDEEWHIISDSSKTVDGTKLDSAIKKGAILYQVSLDKKKWFTMDYQTDITQSSEESKHSISYETQDMELINGCYYRILVVYQLQRKVGSYHVFIDLKDKTEEQRVAEEYIFYASYMDAENNDDLEQTKMNVGDLVLTGTDNGFSGSDAIYDDNPHFGWSLGSFTMYGFDSCSNRGDSSQPNQYTFLKSPKSKISLRFNLKQDIDCLNGKSNLTIADDTNGYDQKLGVTRQDFGYGTMIIRYTDPQNVRHDPVVYTDFLAALTSPRANTKVQIFEEGDYEVALDYEILNSKRFDKYYNYRISFSFKIRNNDSMFFPRDLKNGSELKNGSATTQGFMLDYAGSQYLDVSVKMATYTKDATGKYVEDIRSNIAAKNGQKFTKPGIYTISSFSSKEADPDRQRKTEKQIYVGTDNVVYAHMNSANRNYTIDQIAAMVEDGAIIEKDGSIKPAETTAPVAETTAPVSETTLVFSETTQTTFTTTEKQASETTIMTTSESVAKSTTNTTTTETQESTKSTSGIIPFVSGGIVVAIGGGMALAFKSKKKSRNDNNTIAKGD